MIVNSLDLLVMLVHKHGPWKTADQLEVATLEWVDWYNHQRLHGANADLPPAEYENFHYQQNTTASLDQAS